MHDRDQREVERRALHQRDVVVLRRLTARLPSPGSTNTRSTNTVPLIAFTSTSPSTVTTGSDALRSACFQTTDTLGHAAGAQAADEVAAHHLVHRVARLLRDGGDGDAGRSTAPAAPSPATRPSGPVEAAACSPWPAASAATTAKIAITPARPRTTGRSAPPATACRWRAPPSRRAARWPRPAPGRPTTQTASARPAISDNVTPMRSFSSETAVSLVKYDTPRSPVAAFSRPTAVLRHQRLVQPQFLAQFLVLLFGALALHHRARQVAGRQRVQQERQERHHEQQRNGERQAAQDQAEHG